MRPSATFSGRADDVDALLDCQADVESLFDDLNRKLFDLQALGARYDIQQAEQWEAFSKSWLRRRREVGARCRFDELQGHGLGAAYDHLAVVYDELEEAQRAYAVLLYNYIDHHASRVDDIRHALESSRKTFEQQRAARGGQRDRGDHSEVEIRNEYRSRVRHRRADGPGDGRACVAARRSSAAV